jgi:hypothetical protein
MGYAIKYNRTTNHIAGIAERSKGSEFNYALSACPVLSRSYNLATSGKEIEDLKEALETARKRGGRKVCRKCEAAAVAALEALETATEAPQETEAPEVRKSVLPAVPVEYCQECGKLANLDKHTCEVGPVPANFLELAQHGNTPQARAYWQRRCDNWGK